MILHGLTRVVLKNYLCLALETNHVDAPFLKCLINCLILFFILVIFSIHIDATIMEISISYFKGCENFYMYFFIFS